MFNLYLDGNPVPEDDYTINDFSFKKSVGRDRDYSTEIIFRGDTRDAIYSRLVLNPLGRSEEFRIEIYSRCCGNKRDFVGVITGENISFCEDECELVITPEYKDDAKTAYQCIEDTLIDGTNLVVNGDHPKMRYCNEIRPTFLHDIIMVLGILAAISLGALSSVFVLVLLIATPILAIIAAISFIANIFFDNNLYNDIIDGYTDAMEFAFNILKELSRIIVPCGRIHPAPYVRTWAEGVCQACGITFSSSIYTDPSSDYYNAVMLSATMKRGERNIPQLGIIDQNSPLWYGADLFDNLAKAHNAEWVIEGGVLKFERRDFFQTNALITKLDYRSVCASTKPEPPHSSWRIDFADDNMDTTANESLRPWYKDIVDWNPLNANPAARGTLKVNPQFGGHRQRNDGLDRDVISFWSAPLQFTFNVLVPLLTSPVAGILSIILGNGVNLQQYDEDLILEKGYAQYPKLLTINDQAKVINNNEPYHAEQLYDRFWVIDRPTTGNYPRFDIEIETEFLDCDVWDEYLNSLNKLIPTNLGDVRILEIEAFPASSERYMNIKGEISHITA